MDTVAKTENKPDDGRDAATARLVCWNGDECPWHARGICLFGHEEVSKRLNIVGVSKVEFDQLCASVRRLAAFVMWQQPRSHEDTVSANVTAVVRSADEARPPELTEYMKMDFRGPQQMARPVPPQQQSRTLLTKPGLLGLQSTPRSNPTSCPMGEWSRVW